MFFEVNSLSDFLIHSFYQNDYWNTFHHPLRLGANYEFSHQGCICLCSYLLLPAVWDMCGSLRASVVFRNHRFVHHIIWFPIYVSVTLQHYAFQYSWLYIRHVDTLIVPNLTEYSINLKVLYLIFQSHLFCGV